MEANRLNALAIRHQTSNNQTSDDAKLECEEMNAASSKEDFIEQFKVMNGLIESAILRQDFDHVVKIDQKRRQLIKEFAAVTQPSEDKVFFEALEACAEGNARAISKMKNEMANFAKHSNRKTKAISGYRR